MDIPGFPFENDRGFLVDCQYLFVGLLDGSLRILNVSLDLDPRQNLSIRHGFFSISTHPPSPLSPCIM